MDGPLAIRARGLSKGFSSGPRQPLWRSGASGDAQRNLVLDDVSFDVAAGEFFGVMGRNGSGKSTLLMLLAGIYAPDRGSIEIAGRIAPFLQLGIGFNNELAAYENTVMNGVMMGLSPREARRRFDEIIDFAGLRDHVDLPLKNYSSGMRVRLGFSIMTHVEADILLVDEVLAVGDAEFGQRCDQVFRSMHKAGRTIVLVSHSMEAIDGYCDRAMLIEDGGVKTIGDSGEVTGRYLSTNLRRYVEAGADPSGQLETTAQLLADPPAEIAECRVVDAEGSPRSSLGPEEEVGIRATIRILREMEGPCLYFTLATSAGVILVSGTSEDLGGAGSEPGEVVNASVRIHNRLGPGSYALSCALSQRAGDGVPIPATGPRTLRFDVEGEAAQPALQASCEFAFEQVESAEPGSAEDELRTPVPRTG